MATAELLESCDSVKVNLWMAPDVEVQSTKNLILFLVDLLK